MGAHCVLSGCSLGAASAGEPPDNKLMEQRTNLTGATGDL
jgi:hypothetical protein